MNLGQDGDAAEYKENRKRRELIEMKTQRTKPSHSGIEWELAQLSCSSQKAHRDSWLNAG